MLHEPRELPDVRVSPGALNSQVTQQNIDDTICVKGWTKTIRPPVSYTNRLKYIKMRQYGYGDDQIHDLELDHVIALSMGGAPDDPMNMWPQPKASLLELAHIPAGWSAEDKDALEASLHRQVCDRKVSLREAQQAIGSDWM